MIEINANLSGETCTVNRSSNGTWRIYWKPGERPKKYHKTEHYVDYKKKHSSNMHDAKKRIRALEAHMSPEEVKELWFGVELFKRLAIVVLGLEKVSHLFWGIIT